MKKLIIVLTAIVVVLMTAGACSEKKTKKSVTSLAHDFFDELIEMMNDDSYSWGKEMDFSDPFLGSGNPEDRFTEDLAKIQKKFGKELKDFSDRDDVKLVKAIMGYAGHDTGLYDFEAAMFKLFRYGDPEETGQFMSHVSNGYYSLDDEERDYFEASVVRDMLEAYEQD